MLDGARCPRADRNSAHEGREFELKDGGIDFEQSSGVFCAEIAVKYAFIESNLVAEFPLPVICRVLRVTQAGYHAWLKRPASLMALKRDALTVLIRRVFAAFKGEYGAPPLHPEFCRQHGYTGSRAW